MTNLFELDVDRAMSFALSAVLEGFHSDYWSSWQDFVKDWHGDEIEVDDELAYFDGVWEALEYINTETWWPVAGIELSARVVEGPTRSTVDPDDYYVVLALTDGTATRYIQRMGYYSSYGESSIAEGVNHEVNPVQVVKTEWKNV